ncbi:MAG: M14 family metallopeptidase [Aeoliella sp.]
MLLLSSSAHAAPREKVYQPLGAPADPVVSARWNFYRDYAQTTGLLKQIAASHPEICRIETLGKSYGDREMWVMTITNQAAGDTAKEQEKPAFWIDGGIHANEVQSVDVVLYTAWYLTEMYGRNEFVTKLINERVIYLMPMLSPDSRDAHMYKPNTTHKPRGGQRPVDDDRDGLFDEDPADDFDGDGHITQMRVRDPLGRWKSHDEYPELMIRADNDEAGQYTLLGAEGFDNDDDGSVNEDGAGYYDPNRDWPWQWQPSYVQRGAYRYPFSVPENRMMADFVMAHPHIAGAQSYHNTGGMILRGPGAKTDRWPASDIAVYDRLAERGAKMLPGYRYLNTAEELYEVWGSETDWFHTMVGAYAFVNELNTPFNMFRKTNEGGGFFSSQENQRNFDEWLLLSDGFVAWHEVEHPQHGKIEVGGVKKSWGRQPPSFLLEEECHRNMAFTLWHADQMPKVEIDNVAVKPLGEDLFEVTATLMNRKITPTRSAFNMQNKVTPPDRVELSGDGITVVAAVEADDFLFENNPRDVRRDPTTVRIATIRSWRPKYVRWIVAGAGPYDVTVHSIKGGVAKKSSRATPSN